MKTTTLRKLFTLLVMSSFFLSTQATDLIVSGITNPSAMNGKYVHKGVIFGYDYWKHESAEYYIYNDDYAGRYWNIDGDLNDNDDEDMFFYLSSSDSPVGLSGWGRLEAASGSPSIGEFTATSPTVSTSSVDSLGITSATLGGDVTDDGGQTVTEKGVVYALYSENNNPEIAGNGVTKIADGNGTGSFRESISGLAAGTQYSVKAYAINSVGTSYGNVVNFTTASCNLSATITSLSNVDCYGNSTGSATVTASGGTANYTYEWNNGATTSNTASTTNTVNNLAAGKYVVTVTDANGCSNKDSVVITEPQAISANLSATADGDEDGSLDVEFTITISRTNDTGAPITFDFTTSDGTATAGADYTAVSGGTISVANGQSTGTASVTVLDDADLEAIETLSAEISNPSYSCVSITTATADGNILDDETVTAALSATTDGDEDATVAIEYTVTLSKTNNSGSAITFDFNTAAGTATAGSDYTAVAGGSISVANGASTGTATVTVLDDALLEATETVTGSISNVSNTSVTITTASTYANILDDETATVALSASVDGDENGAVANEYTVTLSKTNNTGSAITFDFNTSDGTATSGSDYTAVAGGSISIADGESTGSTTVDVIDDMENEGTETFSATISNSSNVMVSIATATVSGSIIDNDFPTTLNTTSDEALLLYPNPFNNKLNIVSDFEVKSITITSLNCKVLMFKDLGQNNTLDVSQIPNGLHIVTIIEVSGKHHNFKMMKE